MLWFSKGLVALDTLDFWVGTFMIFVVAGTQIVCFSWVFGVDRGLAAAHLGAEIRIPRVFRFITRYVSPTYLALLGVISLAGWCYRVLCGDDDKDGRALGSAEGQA